MSERILKLQSDQNFAEVAVPYAFTQKLIDFRIPASGMTYDLSKSYINLNMQVDSVGNLDSNGAAIPGAVASDTALFNNDISFASKANGAGAKRLASNSQLVRNADMFSASKGMVESIRRVNTLRNVLWNLENDSAEMRNGLDKSGVFEGRRGTGNKTSTLIQNIGQNVNAAGVADTTLKAQKLSRDFRIPISDLFGVGSSLWNTNYFSETRIHIELQPNQLFIEQLGGSEDTDTFDGQANTPAWGAMQSYDGGASTLATFPQGKGLGTVDAPLITTLIYDDVGLNFPFYVGQAVECAFANSVGAGSGGMVAPATGNIIESIEHITNAVKTRLVAADATLYTNLVVGTVLIIFRNAIATAGAVVQNLTAITLKASKGAATDTITINRAELVLSEVDSDGPMGMDYTTYTTEETQGHAGLNNLTKQVMVEPACTNLIVANCDTGDLMSNQPWLYYRMAIDNVDVSGNRDIVWGESIHKDRMGRFFKNRNQRFTNSTLRQIACNVAQRAYGAGPGAPGNQIAFYPILETMPLSQGTKIVNLELQGTTGNDPKDLVFYKEIQKSI